MNENLKKLMTPEQLSKYLDIKIRTVYSYAQSGQIPGVKIGGQWRFRQDDIDQWIENKINPTGLDNSRPTNSQIFRVQVNLVKAFILEQLSLFHNLEIGLKITQLNERINNEFDLKEDSKITEIAIEELYKNKLIKYSKINKEKSIIKGEK